MQEIQATADLALALSCAVLGLFALAKFIFELPGALRGEPITLTCEDDEEGPFGIWPRDRLRLSARYLGLFGAAGLLLYFAYLDAGKALSLLS